MEEAKTCGDNIIEFYNELVEFCHKNGFYLTSIELSKVKYDTGGIVEVDLPIKLG